MSKEIICSCGVPENLHNTCCGWENASITIFPNEKTFTYPSAEENKKRWELSKKGVKEWNKDLVIKIDVTDV